MSLDHEQPSKWFDPGDVVHYSMMKTWLGDDGAHHMEAGRQDKQDSSEPMDKATKRLLLCGFLVLLVCGVCSFVTQTIGLH